MPALNAQADVAFEALEALQPIPRLTYGLLRSPLLVRRPDDHPDSATAARLLWVSAECAVLAYLAKQVASTLSV